MIFFLFYSRTKRYVVYKRILLNKNSSNSLRRIRIFPKVQWRCHRGNGGDNWFLRPLLVHLLLHLLLVSFFQTLLLIGYESRYTQVLN